MLQSHSTARNSCAAEPDDLHTAVSLSFEGRNMESGACKLASLDYGRAPYYDLFFIESMIRCSHPLLIPSGYACKIISFRMQ